MNVKIDDIVVNYHLIKNPGKPKMLLLHGWGDSLSTFKSQIKRFSKDYEIITVDLPGFGATSVPKEVYNLDKYALFLKKFLDKIAIKNVDIVIGHSNGGAIAIKALSQNYLHPQKLVLLASSGIRNRHNSRKKIFRLLFKILKLSTYLLPTKPRNRLKKKVYQKLGSDLFVAENMQETFKEIVSEDIVDQAKKIKTQTLLIYGEKDVATPVEYGEKFHRAINGSKLVVLPDAGHFIHHEKPDRVDKLILNFIRQNS